jgi:hypothetical protein
VGTECECLDSGALLKGTELGTEYLLFKTMGTELGTEYLLFKTMGYRVGYRVPAMRVPSGYRVDHSRVPSGTRVPKRVPTYVRTTSRGTAVTLIKY